MWQTPKTDWKWINEDEGDFFEIEDYNRIKGNIEYLYNLAINLYSNIDYEEMGADKGYSDYPYADEINKISDNLTHIVTGTYPIEIGVKITYSDNGVFINHTDLNRIEQACLKIYELLTTQAANIPELSIILGIQNIGGL